VKCVTFVSETFTRYGSNITNVWQEIFPPMKLCTKNYENPSIFVKVTAKKSVAPFFLGHGVLYSLYTGWLNKTKYNNNVIIIIVIINHCVVL